ncbi:hypothetical protein C8F04DRAFT_1294791 [Mycena alexandri]|uniref:Uncharacterized protein n=1 Tax=Mycena alexandri TaxID=1745969 RepID=A0AAD6WU05_9AGAR|nr:hypothetical protein C8F04DRAFT_1294791 [Mycena alexandri]
MPPPPRPAPTGALPPAAGDGGGGGGGTGSSNGRTSFRESRAPSLSVSFLDTPGPPSIASTKSLLLVPVSVFLNTYSPLCLAIPTFLCCSLYPALLLLALVSAGGLKKCRPLALSAYPTVGRRLVWPPTLPARPTIGSPLVCIPTPLSLPLSPQTALSPPSPPRSTPLPSAVLAESPISPAQPVLTRWKSTPPAVSQRQLFVDQIALHLANSCLYAHDRSEGAVYCFVELKKEQYDGVKDGTVSLTQLLPSLWVKFGSAKDVSHRREGYAKCDAGGHRRLWLFSFRTRHRYRIERLCHLAFLCDAERDIVCCSGCDKFHRELWCFLQVARSLSDVKQMISEFLTAIGEHPVITKLDDHRYAEQ